MGSTYTKGVVVAVQFKQAPYAHRGLSDEWRRDTPQHLYFGKQFMTLKKHLQTRLVQPDQAPPPGFRSLSPAVERASTVVFPDVAALRHSDWRSEEEYSYGLHGTPTSKALEQRLADLEGAKYCLLAPSGLAALTLVYLSFLSTGDEVLVPDNAYGPSQEFARQLEDQFGIQTRYYAPLSGAGISTLMSPRTRLVWAESPGSITMEVPDVAAIANAAHANGAIVAIDNTWSAGLALKPFALGADVSVQALTKYQSGGSDVLMGSITTVDDALHQQLKLMRRRLGYGVGMEDCYLILRSLPSLQVRFEAHGRHGLEIAGWLKNRPEVTHVLHPAFEDCPGHENFQREFNGAGGLFSIIFDEIYTRAQTDAWVDALSLFKIGYSWGGSTSLAVPYEMAASRSATTWPHRGQLVRLYVGLEDPRDLISDLEAAFLVMHDTK